MLFRGPDGVPQLVPRSQSSSIAKGFSSPRTGGCRSRWPLRKPAYTADIRPCKKPPAKAGRGIDANGPHPRMAAISTWTPVVCAWRRDERATGTLQSRLARSSRQPRLPQASRSYGLPCPHPCASTRSLRMPAAPRASPHASIARMLAVSRVVSAPYVSAPYVHCETRSPRPGPTPLTRARR
jgi:hypothetical protein